MNNATGEDYLREEANNDLEQWKIATDFQPSTGCWIDDRWGHYSSARLIQIAIDLGWDDEEAVYLADLYMTYDHEITAYEADKVYAASEDAENWLNDNIAKPGYYFGWHEGEFFLMHETWWLEKY